MPVAAFAAGAAIALLALRLLLAVINYVATKRRRHISTMIVLGSGAHRGSRLPLRCRVCTRCIWRSGGGWVRCALRGNCADTAAAACARHSLRQTAW